MLRFHLILMKLRVVAVQRFSFHPRASVARRVKALCTPGMGVSVGVQVPCRRFTFMGKSTHEDNYKSKARASPRDEV